MGKGVDIMRACGLCKGAGVIGGGIVPVVSCGLCKGEGTRTMWYDVMIRVNTEDINMKQIVHTYRVRLQELNNHLRRNQDAGHYILGVIPLFRGKDNEDVTANEIKDDELKEDESIDILQRDNRRAQDDKFHGY